MYNKRWYRYTIIVAAVNALFTAMFFGSSLGSSFGTTVFVFVAGVGVDSGVVAAAAAAAAAVAAAAVALAAVALFTAIVNGTTPLGTSTFFLLWR